MRPLRKAFAANNIIQVMPTTMIRLTEGEIRTNRRPPGAIQRGRLFRGATKQGNITVDRASAKGRASGDGDGDGQGKGGGDKAV
jgi:hypothetical protein